MSVSTSVNLNDRLTNLLAYIREGLIIDAMNEFYAEDVVMQENLEPPTAGRDANIEREKQFLSMIKEWKGFQVISQGSGQDVTFYETVMDWVATDNTPVHVEQVVVAKWQDGKIIHERFYHNP